MSSLPARLRRWAHFRNPSFRSTQSVQHLPHYSMSSASDTSFNFERIFSAALAEYTKQTGKNLRNHPLANRIDSCNSAESILGIFEEQSQAFEIFRNSDIKQSKLLKWLKPVVNVLHALSTNEVFKACVGHVSPATFLIIHSVYLNTLSPRRIHPRKRFSPVLGFFYLCVSPSLPPPHPLSHLSSARRPSMWGQVTTP